MVSDKLKKERLSFVEKAVIAIGQNLAVSESFEVSIPYNLHMITCIDTSAEPKWFIPNSKA